MAMRVYFYWIIHIDKEYLYAIYTQNSKASASYTGVPDDFGKTLRNDNGLYKTTSYEPSNKNQPYKAKKCSTPKPYQGHTYKHTVNTNRQYREYEARTYDNVYVYSKIYHEKPKKEAPQRAESPPPQQKTETPPPVSFIFIQLNDFSNEWQCKEEWHFSFSPDAWE